MGIHINLCVDSLEALKIVKESFQCLGRQGSGCLLKIVENLSLTLPQLRIARLRGIFTDTTFPGMDFLRIRFNIRNMEILICQILIDKKRTFSPIQEALAALDSLNLLLEERFSKTCADKTFQAFPGG